MENQRSREVLGAVNVLLAALLWGTLTPLARLVIARGLAPVEVAFWRIAVSAGCFAIHAAATGRAGLPRRVVPHVLALGIASTALLFGAYFTAVAHLGAARAVVLLYLAPTLTVLLAAWRAATRPTPTLLLSALLAAVGVGASSGSVSLFSPAAADLFGLLAGIIAALALAIYPMLAQPAVRAAGTVPAYFWAMLTGACVLLPLVRFCAKSPDVWALLLVIGVGPGYLASSLYARGIRTLPAERAAVLGTAEPLTVLLIGWTWLGEQVTAGALVGAGCILAATLLASRRVPSPMFSSTTLHEEC
jgi:DME family drug/metabolite transporter